MTVAASDTLFFYDDPDRVNNPRHIPQQCQKDIDPEMETNTYLQKNTHRWQHDCQQNAKDIHLPFPFPFRNT